MYRGAFEPLPAPLGGDGTVEGINAAQWSRITADAVAAWRTLPLVVVRFQSNNGTVLASLCRWGAGTDHPEAVTVSRLGTGNYRVVFSASYEDELENNHVPNLFFATATANTVDREAYVFSVNADYIQVRSANTSTGAAADSDITVVIYGDWGPTRSIGDYGGSLTKKDDLLEHPVPYAAQIYTDLKLQSGSAYTQSAASFVHAKNLARARMWSAVGWRLPDKFKNNAFGPQKSDEGLEYWSRVFGISRRANETKQALRNRLAIHKKPGVGATYDNLVDEVSGLIGDAFVGITLNFDDQFETPPTNTYWPVINPGPATFNIGGGAWLSERQQIIINAQQPPGMPAGEFQQLMNVELFELVDRLIPIWCTAQWQDSDTQRVVWDGAGITWDGGAVWSDLFDWNS